MRIDRMQLYTELRRQGLTQKRLAETSGVSRTIVTAVLGGKTCSDKTGRALAAALGVDLGSILEK